MLKKTFEKCMWEELTLHFNLERIEDLPALQKLMLADEKAVDYTLLQLQKLNKLVIKHFLDWNEDEFKMQFISPLLHLIDYNDNSKYQPFSQRALAMRTEIAELSGFVEWILASGVQIPREPFFFLHEYKREQGTDNDPLGQLLAAMLTAQYLNTDTERALYGCYVVGKDWYFVGLHGKKYQTTLAYNVTEFDKLEKVYSILTKIKTVI